MSNKEEQQSEKAETKQESWLKVENIDGNKDYSKIDYSKFFNLQTPIQRDPLCQRRYPLESTIVHLRRSNPLELTIYY